jgi:type II secretion system protein J
VLFTALRLRDNTAAMVDAASPVDATVSYLKRDLQCSVPPTNGTSKVLSGSFRAGNGITSAGVSDPVSVEMFTATGALSERQPWGEIQRVTYGLKNPTDARRAGKELYRTVRRNLLSTSAPEVEEQLMLDGVESLRVSCYDGSQWQESWDTSNQSAVNTNLPLAVRVEIKLSGNPLNEPIQLVVPIDAVARTNRTVTVASGG